MFFLPRHLNSTDNLTSITNMLVCSLARGSLDTRGLFPEALTAVTHLIIDLLILHSVNSLFVISPNVKSCFFAPDTFLMLFLFIPEMLCIVFHCQKENVDPSLCAETFLGSPAIWTARKTSKEKHQGAHLFLSLCSELQLMNEFLTLSLRMSQVINQSDSL